MAKTVQIRWRSYLPGAGFDASGNPKQGKQEVHGRVTVTSYTKGGESLKPSDLGLTAIDHLNLQLVEPIRNEDPGQNSRRVDYSHSAQQFYVVNVGTSGTTSEAAGASTPNLTFEAVGDSAHDVELL